MNAYMSHAVECIVAFFIRVCPSTESLNVALDSVSVRFSFKNVIQTDSELSIS